MDDVERYLDTRAGRDAEFRKLWERGAVELDFRKALIGARLAAGLSQGELARRIGTSESSVTSLEIGASRPRLETLLKVAAALGVRFELDGAGIHLRPGA
jgi:DNA-binding XRE family transcriptional regulator